MNHAENFGNFHYGAVGMAFCYGTYFTEKLLLKEAGRAQQAAGTSKSSWGYPGNRLCPWCGQPPYGDDPKDQKFIKQGVDYYRNPNNWYLPPHPWIDLPWYA